MRLQTFYRCRKAKCQIVFLNSSNNEENKELNKLREVVDQIPEGFKYVKAKKKYQPIFSENSNFVKNFMDRIDPNKSFFEEPKYKQFLCLVKKEKMEDLMEVWKDSFQRVYQINFINQDQDLSRKDELKELAKSNSRYQ